MNFSELEALMSSRGVTTLAEIARTLNTTPQAVSNWKARGQVPYHIVDKMNQIIASNENGKQNLNLEKNIFPNNTLSLSDILLTIGQQIKIILLVPIIFAFLTFTYIKFIEKPMYQSWSTILLPENKNSNLGGLASIASQFGVNVPSGVQADLSSPSLLPELLYSRTFAEKILNKKIYSEKYGKELSLLEVLHGGSLPKDKDPNIIINSAVGQLLNMIEFGKEGRDSFSVLRVTASEPIFAKELAELVLLELENLNRYFKSQQVNEKSLFIANRIQSVQKDLNDSEQRLKEFNEQNRQISSPSLKLQEDRLMRDIEIQRGIYLTLKQQLELAKIEEVQETTILQVLDSPKIPLGPINNYLKLKVIFSVLLGLGTGILLGFIRSYINNPDIVERKKIRRFKNFSIKKSKDFLQDSRIYGLLSILLILALPFYFGHESENPQFFGIYSRQMMLINIVYIVVLLFVLFSFFKLKQKKNINN